MFKKYFGNKNSGYSGYSMSNRAVEAYSNGEMPLSNWSKQAILDAYPEEIAEKLKKFNLETLRNNCLKYSGWHHTGKYCNKTDFYEIIEDIDLSNITVYKTEKNKVEIEKNIYYHGSYEIKNFHPYSRHRKMEITIETFTNAVKKGDWLIINARGDKKRFDLCKIKKTTKRKMSRKEIEKWQNERR